MERIRRAFERRAERAAFIPFLTAGDPDPDSSLQLFRTLLRAGADILEIGVPYSDPLADGHVIQQSAQRSLRAGFRLPRAFDLAATLRRETEQALVLFTYVNPVLQYSPERFFADASAAGVDGVIVPDLPHEESHDIRSIADARGIALIPLVAPTSGNQRIAAIAADARGFVYCVSSLGVTGERTELSVGLRELVSTVRSYSRLPVAVGFGVSTAVQARAIGSYADGVIVGSALIRRIESHVAVGNADIGSLCEDLYQFAAGLVSGLTDADSARQPVSGGERGGENR